MEEKDTQEVKESPAEKVEEQKPEEKTYSTNDIDAKFRALEERIKLMIEEIKIKKSENEDQKTENNNVNERKWL